MNFDPSPHELRQIAATIGTKDPEALAADIRRTLEDYQWRRLNSRDTHPTVAEAHQTSIEIEKRLAWIMDALLGKDQNPFLAVWLSGALTGNDKGPLLEFPEAVMQLLRVVRQVNDDFERNADELFEVDGTPHRRKTRTKTRDTFLIPKLILDAMTHGENVGAPDTAVNDLEAIDNLCDFVSLCLNVAKIQAPDSGETQREGEIAQGRLRRLVKEILREFPNILAIDK